VCGGASDACGMSKTKSLVCVSLAALIACRPAGQSIRFLRCRLVTLSVHVQLWLSAWGLPLIAGPVALLPRPR